MTTGWRESEGGGGDWNPTERAVPSSPSSGKPRNDVHRCAPALRSYTFFIPSFALHTFCHLLISLLLISLLLFSLCSVLCRSFLCCSFLCCSFLCCSFLCCSFLCCSFLYCSFLCCPFLCCYFPCCSFLCCPFLCCSILHPFIHASHHCGLVSAQSLLIHLLFGSFTCLLIELNAQLGIFTQPYSLNGQLQSNSSSTHIRPVHCLIVTMKPPWQEMQRNILQCLPLPLHVLAEDFTYIGICRMPHQIKAPWSHVCSLLCMVTA